MVENQQINEANLKRELYELYIDIKSYLISLNENITNDSEIETSSEPLLIIKTIHDYINIIKNNKKINLISQLENIIIKLEKDLKYHIKNEFMLKIQKDSADSKIRSFMEMEEEFEELKEKVRYEGGKFLNNDRKDNEIKILRRENSNIKREVKKMEIKIRNLEKKGLEDQGIIDELKIKIIKSDKKLEEMEKELEVLKNKKSMEIENHENKNIYLKIVDKNSLSKININSIGNNKMGMRLKRDLTNYQWPLSQVNYESVKSNNNNQRTVDNTSNKLIIHTFDKVNNRNNKNVIAPLRNVKLKDEFKYKNNSISMRSDENKKFEIIGKYLPNNVNKYIPNTKVRNLSKDNNIKYGLFNLPSSSSNVNIRHPKKEEKNFHEYSGFNKLI
jgi:hypothetical protein